MLPTITTAPPSINFNNDPMIFEVETANKTGAGPYEWSEDNLSGYMQVWFNDNLNVDSFITELNPNYNTADGKTAVNLVRLAPLDLLPPPDSALLESDVTSGRIIEASGSLVVKYGDQYGIPKEIEDPLAQSAFYQVVYGSSKYWNGFTDKYSDTVILLHSWRNFKRSVNFNQFYKEVTQEQPEYIGVFCQDESASVDITIRVYKSDGGTTDLTTKTITALRGVNWINVKPSLLGVFGVTDGVSYRIGNLTMGYLYYAMLESEPADSLYLLMDNGCGIFETIRMQGKIDFSHEVSFVEQEKAVWIGSNFREGRISQHFKSGVPTIEANSGYYSREYIEHISQLLYGKVWLIDTVRNKFLAHRVTSSKITESDTHTDLFNIKIEVAQGWRDYSSNTFNQ